MEGILISIFPDKESKTEKVSGFSSHIQEVKGVSIIKNLETSRVNSTFSAMFWHCSDKSVVTRQEPEIKYLLYHLLVV